MAESASLSTKTKHVSNWAKVAMAYAVEKGLLEGRANAVLYPNATATRAEVADRIVIVEKLMF